MSERMIDREYIRNMPDVIQLHELNMSCECRLCEPEKEGITLECECLACGCSFMWVGELFDKILCINCGEEV